MFPRRCWACLPGDPLREIASRLDSRIYNPRLRAVCSSWRWEIPRRDPVLPFTLPNLARSALNPFLPRLAFAESTIYMVEPVDSIAPQPQLHYDADADDDSDDASIIDVEPYDLWMIRVEDTANANMHPLHPLSKWTADNVPAIFPKGLNLQDFRVSPIAQACRCLKAKGKKRAAVDKIVLSDTEWSSARAAMALAGGQLYFIELDGQEWIPLPHSADFADVLYHRGRFWAVDRTGRTLSIGHALATCEIGQSLATELPPPGSDSDSSYAESDNVKHLVISGGNLFLVDMDPYLYGDEQINDRHWEKPYFEVYELDERRQKWDAVQNLEQPLVFFIGDDNCFSLSIQEFPNVPPDCIYFTHLPLVDDDDGGDPVISQFCSDIGVFSTILDFTCEALPHNSHFAAIFWPPPAWIEP